MIKPNPSQLVTDELVRWACQFNQHLNACPHCAQNPLSLCEVGEKILRSMPRD